jgi:hypothetical protein
VRVYHKRLLLTAHKFLFMAVKYKHKRYKISGEFQKKIKMACVTVYPVFSDKYRISFEWQSQPHKTFESGISIFFTKSSNMNGHFPYVVQATIVLRLYRLEGIVFVRHKFVLFSKQSASIITVTVTR